MANAWYGNDVALPFGEGDANLGGNHGVDFKTPFHTRITAIMQGMVSDVRYTPWGGQVTVKLDNPINGVPYAALVHLDEINTNLHVGQHISFGDFIGLSGGQNSGGSHPVASIWSSQPQTGFFLSYGPAYGYGSGWNEGNPLWAHPELNPTSYLNAIRTGNTSVSGMSNTVNNTADNTLANGASPSINQGTVSDNPVLPTDTGNPIQDAIDSLWNNLSGFRHTIGNDITLFLEAGMLFVIGIVLFIVGIVLIANMSGSDIGNVAKNTVKS